MCAGNDSEDLNNILPIPIFSKSAQTPSQANIPTLLKYLSLRSASLSLYNNLTCLKTSADFTLTSRAVLSMARLGTALSTVVQKTTIMDARCNTNRKQYLNIFKPMLQHWYKNDAWLKSTVHGL